MRRRPWLSAPDPVRWLDALRHARDVLGEAQASALHFIGLPARDDVRRAQDRMTALEDRLRALGARVARRASAFKGSSRERGS